jgi:hypothetical protein
MRRKAAAVVLVIAIAVGTVHAKGGLAFSLRPGLLINAAQIGYKTDNLFVGAGLEFASASLSTKLTSDSFKSTSKFDVSVFLPQAAARVFFGGVGEEASGAGFARPYVGASLFYSIAGASITTSDGETTQRDTTTEKLVKDVLGGNLGGTASFGGEYYIARSLSLGGEFGVRFLFGGVKTKYESYYGTETMTASLGLGLTYTTLGLNFYF